MLLTIVVYSPVIYWQHNHSSHHYGGMHEINEMHAPHSGAIKKAGKYRVEMVAELILKEDQLTFYFLRTRNIK